MPTATLTVTGTTSNTNGLEGAATAHQCLATNDGDTTFVYVFAGNEGSSKCSHTQLESGAGSINSATNYNITKFNGPGGHGASANWDGNSWSAGQNSTNSYAAYGDSHDAARLTVALVNSDDIGVYLTAVDQPEYCTQIYRYVDYELGGLHFNLIYSWLGPALFGASLLYRDFLSAVRYAATYIPGRTTTFYRPDEVEGMWRSYRDKEYKFPAFAIPSDRITLRNCHVYY